MATVKSLNFLKPIANPENARLDIVAIHGLNIEDKEDHAESTWTASNKKMWLKDFLPTQLPEARVLLFGYNSNVGVGASTAGIDEQAENLLNRLRNRRKARHKKPLGTQFRSEAEERPIIFICHSLGGIIVKKALIIAKHDETYESIQKSCYGIVFFGTPHRGGNVASLQNIAASIAQQNQASTFLEALKKDSLFADNISKEFRHQLENYWVVTVYETQPPSKIIVDRKSATLGLSGKRERQIPMDADHENICKFEAIDGDDYEQVGANILELAKNAIKNTSQQSKSYNLKPETMQALCPSDPENHRFDLIQRKGKRFGGTCQWILKEPEFEDWNSPEAGSGILWVHGKPGVGKTMISDFLIETFESETNSSLAYFFCDEKDGRRNTANPILQGFLWQILKQRPDLSGDIELRYSQEGKGVFENIRTLYTMFLQLMRDETIGNVYWVIDGLDECEGMSRSAFLELISREFTAFAGRVKLVIVSRPLEEIQSHLKKIPSMKAIHVESETNNDIDGYIDYRCQELAKRQKYQETLAQRVRLALKEGAENIFLWVSLMIEELESCDAESIEETLHHLPKGLDGVYERILSHTPDKARKTAISVLSWIAMAARPLTEKELAVARAKFLQSRIEPVELEADLRLCVRFITSRDGKIHLIHQSVKDYLFKPSTSASIFGPISSHTYNAEKTHSELAQACLLSLTEKNGGRNTTAGGFPQYAESYWFHHLRQRSGYPSSGPLREILEKFISDKSNFSIGWFERYWSFHEAAEEYPPKVTALHIASYVGVCPLVQQIFMGLSLKRKTKLRFSTNGTSPLHLAACNGHSDVVKLLLSYQINVNAKTQNTGMSALHLAARGGHLGMLEILLDGGAKIEAKDNDGTTALYLAAMYKHEECITFLVTRGADKSQRVKGETLGRNSALVWAVETGNVILVKRMLDHGVGVSPAVLLSAVKNQHEGVVKLLLEKGADINSKDDSGDTALHCAARGGNEEIVKLLLENGADSNSKDGSGDTALHCAARGGNEEIVKLLLENGADINSKDGSGDTALHWLAREGNEEIVKLLLEKGADSNSKDGPGNTALHWAARRGDEAIVKLLLENGADSNSKDRSGGTALHCAAHEGDWAIVELLLEKGADINSKDCWGGTVLHQAARRGNEATVKLLLEKGADINSKDGLGGTALHQTARVGNEATVKLLLEKGADINSKDCWGDTALHQVARWRNGAIVKLLLENGADSNSKDGSGDTVLHQAARWGNEAIVKLLLEKGADINSKDGSGGTALDLAAKRGYKTVVKFLLANGAHYGVEKPRPWYSPR